MGKQCSKIKKWWHKRTYDVMPLIILAECQGAGKWKGRVTSNYCCSMRKGVWNLCLYKAAGYHKSSELVEVDEKVNHQGQKKNIGCIT